MSDSQREWWLARHRLREQEHSCGHPSDVCSDPALPWFPQRHVCHVSMEREAAAREYARLHEKKPYHDGTFESWVEKRDDAHPYHFNDGVTIYAADTDLNPHDHFLGGAEDCDECREVVDDGDQA